jgi:hypothetical protein
MDIIPVNTEYLTDNEMSDDAGADDQELRIGGLWWRADRYEIRDGRIRPIPGAEIEPYDPWATYVRTRRGISGADSPSAPYSALLELAWRARLITPRAGQRARLTPEWEALILEWCASHGLLGIVLQETEAAYYAARWGNARVDDDGQREGVLQPIRITYTWTGSVWEVGGWARQEEPWSLPADPLRRVPFDNEDGIYQGQLVRPELVAGRWRPEILARSTEDAAYTSRMLGPAWGAFFPAVSPDERSTHEYPWPAGERWWAEYAEPVERFLEAGSLLLEVLTTLEPGVDPKESWAARHGGVPTRGQIALHSLLQSVRPTLHRSSDGDWTGGWRTKSLLSTYAMMAYLDVLAGKRILSCDTCGKPYVSGAYQARYCSDRCRNTALKRAYRSRRRERNDESAEPGV